MVSTLVRGCTHTSLQTKTLPYPILHGIGARCLVNDIDVYTTQHPSLAHAEGHTNSHACLGSHMAWLPRDCV